MKYRKKPAVIDAMQFNGLNAVQIIDGLSTDRDSIGFGGGELHIITLEGVMRAQKGDWIIKGVRGELYPCKPDIFEATYEPVTD